METSSFRDGIITTNYIIYHTIPCNNLHEKSYTNMNILFQFYNLKDIIKLKIAEASYLSRNIDNTLFDILQHPQSVSWQVF